jgi:hypothetical protein
VVLSRLKFSEHATQRMFERHLSTQEVRAVLEQGDLVEEYLDDLPLPSRLVVGRQRGRWLHVVVAHDPETDTTVVITVYEPDPSQWEPPDYRRRRIR